MAGELYRCSHLDGRFRMERENPRPSGPSRTLRWSPTTWTPTMLSISPYVPESTFLRNASLSICDIVRLRVATFPCLQPLLPIRIGRFRSIETRPRPMAKPVSGRRPLEGCAISLPLKLRFRFVVSLASTRHHWCACSRLNTGLTVESGLSGAFIV